MSRPDFISLCTDKGTKKFAVTHTEAVSVSKKNRNEKLYCEVNYRYLKEEMYFRGLGHAPTFCTGLVEPHTKLYNENTKKNSGRFLTTGGIKEIKRHFPASVKEWNNSGWAGRNFSSRQHGFHTSSSASLLHPFFISYPGPFCDAAESSFIISVHKNSKYKEGYNVQACFSICIHKKDRALLVKIASTPPLRGGDVSSLAGETFYGVGNITKAGLARIQSIKGGMNRGRQMSTWARPQLDQVREDFKSILQRGIHTAPTVKNNSPIKKDNNKLVPIVKHFPASTLEWTNSVYAYNTKKSILFPIIDKIVIKLIKSNFNAYFSSSRPALIARPAAGDRTKIRKLSVLKRMNISKLELKHTNSKVVIVVYVYCAELKNLEFLYKNLSDLLAKYYNKKVELRVIRLREMQLNAKILAERLAIELNQRIRSPLRTIRNALKTVRTSKVNIKLYYLKKTSSLIKKYSALYNNISTLNVGDLKKIQKTVRNEVIMSTKYKAITGLKIQIAGRLTRRATAAKAVFKGGQVGGLRNFDSSVLGFSVGLLRGHRNPNLQKSYHNSKTKNGSFNVRVWTSSFYSTLAKHPSSASINPYFVTGFCDASKKALVVWGTNLESTVGSGRFTKQVSNVIKLPPAIL